MKIDIVWGKSEGKTVLSAFDKALFQAGIHNLNLLQLSSVIPQNAVVEEVGKTDPQKKVGDILYVVLASTGSRKPGVVITAGLGWVQTEHGGLFLESEGEMSQEECEEELRAGLKEMLKVRDWDGKINTRVISHKVENIANVIVSAVYHGL
jgi:arginine decarboxylase